MKQSSFQSVKSLFEQFQAPVSKGYITQEFQDYGYRLACDLDDVAHKSLYIRLAKTEDRGLLEQARRYVIDASSAKSKAKLFMWKLQQLKNERRPAE